MKVRCMTACENIVSTENDFIVEPASGEQDIAVTVTVWCMCVRPNLSGP